MKIAPTEVIQAIQQENLQAAAGKIGGQPVPTGLRDIGRAGGRSTDERDGRLHLHVTRQRRESASRERAGHKAGRGLNVDRVGKFGAGFGGPNGGGALTHNRWYASIFYDGPAGSWLGGLDTGLIVHYIGDYWDDRLFTSDQKPRKVREWTTLDLVLNYTFNSSASVAQNEVAGFARDGGKNSKMKDGKGKNVMPVSTAEYNPCGRRAWLNNTTITLGLNNVFDLAPPFVAGSGENGYDEATANIKGRTWYVALTKRF